MHSRTYVKIMNSAAWKAARTRQMSREPWCERCRELGRVRAARCVHHVREVETGLSEAECWRIALDEGNLRSLCFECHAEAHALARSHSRDAHRERMEQRLARWRARTESLGADFFPGGAMFPKSTCPGGRREG